MDDPIIGPDWLDANFYQAKIMASQYIGLPKLDHAKMLAKNLGTHLVWCQPIISSLARFQKFLVTCQNFGYNDQFLGMNQMIAKSFWHALILACQKLVANQAGSISTSYKNSLYQTPYHYPLELDHPSISSTNFFVNVGMQSP